MGAAEGSFPGPYEDSVTWEAEQAENQEKQTVYDRLNDLEKRVKELEKKNGN